MPSIHDVAKAWVAHATTGKGRGLGSTGVQTSYHGHGLVTRVSWCGNVISSHGTPVAKIYGAPGAEQFALVTSDQHSPSTNNQLGHIAGQLGGMRKFCVPCIGAPGGWNKHDIGISGLDDPKWELLHLDNVRFLRACWQQAITECKRAWKPRAWEQDAYWGVPARLERAWTPLADYVGYFTLKVELPRLAEAIAEVEAYRAEMNRVYALPANVERRARAAARRLLKKVMLPED